MQILNLVQGSDEWAATRARHFTASEASVMMGASKRATRADLLRIKALGTATEVSEWVQAHLFDKGHEYEALARPIAEGIIGEELYPATALDDDGYLLASFDGATMLGDAIWEHKSWNTEKADLVFRKICPPEDYWQVVQQLAVSGAKRCLYMVSDGTEKGCVHMWVDRSEDDIDALMAGWAQFAKDLAAYEHKEVREAPAGTAPDALPVLYVEIAGEVKQSNLVPFRDAVIQRIKAINTDLKTDEDFADAEATVKWLGEREKEIDGVKERAQANAATIDELFRTLDTLKEEMRQKRLELNKTVTSRKDSIRAEIRDAAIAALRDHVAMINADLGDGRVQIPEIKADFGAAMKNKRTLKSLHDAVDAELAKAKIEASRWETLILKNLATIDSIGRDHLFLFKDIQQLVLKDHSDVTTLVEARVAAYAAEQMRNEAQA